jgi:hypothetical protein
VWSDLRVSGARVFCEMQLSLARGLPYNTASGRGFSARCNCHWRGDYPTILRLGEGFLRDATVTGEGIT